MVSTDVINWWRFSSPRGTNRSTGFSGCVFPFPPRLALVHFVCGSILLNSVCVCVCASFHQFFPSVCTYYFFATLNSALVQNSLLESKLSLCYSSISLKFIFVARTRIFLSGVFHLTSLSFFFRFYVLYFCIRTNLRSDEPSYYASTEQNSAEDYALPLSLHFKKL